MTKWLIGGLVALAGVCIYLTLAKRGSPPPALPATAAPAAAAPAAPAPALLTQVVDVTEIDSLLDPPAIPPSDGPASGAQITRVGYEEAPAAPTPVNVQPIPPAKEDDEE